MLDIFVIDQACQLCWLKAVYSHRFLLLLHLSEHLSPKAVAFLRGVLTLATTSLLLLFLDVLLAILSSISAGWAPLFSIQVLVFSIPTNMHRTLTLQHGNQYFVSWHPLVLRWWYLLCLEFLLRHIGTGETHSWTRRWI